jgi:hypothetical protein
MPRATDPDAWLHRMGADKEAKLRFMVHALTENRTGLAGEAVSTALWNCPRFAPDRQLGADPPRNEGTFQAAALVASDPIGRAMTPARRLCFRR